MKSFTSVPAFGAIAPRVDPFVRDQFRGRIPADGGRRGESVSGARSATCGQVSWHCDGQPKARSRYRLRTKESRLAFFAARSANSDDAEAKAGFAQWPEMTVRRSDP